HRLPCSGYCNASFIPSPSQGDRFHDFPSCRLSGNFLLPLLGVTGRRGCFRIQPKGKRGPTSSTLALLGYQCVGQPLALASSASMSFLSCSSPSGLKPTATCSTFPSGPIT